MDAASSTFPAIRPMLGPEALGRFHLASQDWSGSGAQWIDLPWMVPAPFVLATRPTQARGQDVATPHGFLLASGEQAFLWVDEQKRLQPRLWLGWTPCFRDEPVFDDLHQYAFIKLELYRPLASTEDPHAVLRDLVDLACTHFQAWSRQSCQTRLISAEQWDIEINGVEVGSYGVRAHPTIMGRQYVYGTALAEPRFSYAIKKS